jgi:hypothetical protein
MPVYEIIWESGEHSLANYADDDEMTLAVLAQHDRAKNGEKGGPAGAVATRAVKVFKYATDPGEISDSLSADEVKAQLSEAVDALADENGVTYLPDLVGIVANVRSATVQSAPHDSNYKMEAEKEFPIATLEKAGDK